MNIERLTTMGALNEDKIRQSCVTELNRQVLKPYILFELVVRFIIGNNYSQ